MKKFFVCLFAAAVLLLVSVTAIGSLGLDTAPVETGLNNLAGRIMRLAGKSETDNWKLKLVNKWNPLEDGYKVETGTTSSGYLFDSRVVKALDDMLLAGERAGLSLVLTSAYRSREYQQSLYDDKIQRLMSEGYGFAEASALGAREVAQPGTSEHELGLAADIVCSYYPILDDGYADTAEAVWLRENCSEYGFILRYPEDKSDVTGIVFEPWHFRYVGVEAAQYIMDNGLCLEEYLENVL